MKTYQISEEFLLSLVDYLARRPYFEVHQFVSVLQAVVADQNKPDEKVETEDK